jgi:hypothetical protein
MLIILSVAYPGLLIRLSLLTGERLASRSPVLWRKLIIPPGRNRIAPIADPQTGQGRIRKNVCFAPTFRGDDFHAADGMLVSRAQYAQGLNQLTSIAVLKK